MKYTKSLVILMLCLNYLSHCTETPQSSPATTASWWERSKNYAASWVPQSIKYQAKTLSRSLNDNLNPIRMGQLFREKITIAKSLSAIMDNKIKNPNLDMNPQINNLMQHVSTRAIELDFDPNKMIEDGINYRYAIIMQKKRQLIAKANDELRENKYAMRTASEDANKALLDFYRNELIKLNLEHQILYEIAKIMRNTDLTKKSA